MGKAFSMIARPVKNFNIESRAHKVISKEKPTAAPKHKSYIDQAEQLLKDDPESLNKLLKKNTTLDSHLKDVFVKSHDPEILASKTESGRSTVDRPLPLSRRQVEQFEFGFQEPTTMPIGRCSLRQALKFLTNHQEDPKLWDSKKIALDHSIPEEKIKNILKYFRIYKVYIPEKESKVVFAGPSIPKSRIGKSAKEEMLESGNAEKTK